MKKSELIKLVTLCALVIIAYIPSIIWMIERWSVKDTYYSHGFLIPFISAFLVWHKRERLSKIKTESSGAGWIFFGGALFIYLISALIRVNFTAALSVVPAVIGIGLLFFGWEMLRELLFPIAFLLFMIPLPSVAIVNISFKLKILAAKIATGLVNLMGVPAMREGSIIKTYHSYLVVEDPCSGIRSLIALIALGALMAYFSNISKVRKGVLFLASIPIATGTNVIRIVLLTLVGEMYGAKYASGIFHDTLGVLVFVIAFVGLSLVGKILE